MRKNNLTALLTDLRALILNSRPAYRDFLSEVTETKTTKILENVVLAENQLMLPVADAAFSGFIAGEAYRVVLDSEEKSVIAKDFSGAVVLSNVEDLSNPPNDAWALQYDSEEEKMIAGTSGAFLGATISVYYDDTVTEQKWSVRKLAYELLPDRLLSALSAAADTARKALTAAKAAQSTANAAQSTANAAQSTANAAQSTANAAQSTADAAQSTADAAQSTANAAQATAETAKATAETAKTTAETAVKPSKSGEDTCYYTMYNPYADYKPTRVMVGTSGGSALKIEVNKEPYPSVAFVPPVYLTQQADFEFRRAGSGYPHPLITGIGGIVVYSSTPKSTKKFKVTVDDAGTLSATEVTDTTT
jgi:hypothetical protein